MRKLSFKMIAVLQLLVVIVTFFSWWLYRTAVYLHAPMGPHDEYYPHNWGFQAIVGIVYLVGLLVVTVVVIMLERWMYDLFVNAGRVKVLHITAALLLTFGLLIGGAWAADAYNLPLIHAWALAHGSILIIFPLYFWGCYSALKPLVNRLRTIHQG